VTSGHRHLAIVGPTASGKSALAMQLAREAGDVEIVSIDSMQVYRGMDIGTAKPTPEEQAEIRHHLIDLADPSDDFTVARFQRAFRAAMAGIEQRGQRALLVGGTGLYLRAVVDDLAIPGQFPHVRRELEAQPDTVALHRRLLALDSLAAGRMEPTNRRRVIRALEVTIGSGRPFSSYGPGLEAYPPSPFRQIGLHVEPELLRQRIADRYAQQMAAGFLEEVRALHFRPEDLSRTARQALGYKELLGHLGGECDLETALDTAISRTRRFARRQRVWFRRDPRITWYPADDDNLVAVAAEVLVDWAGCA